MAGGSYLTFNDGAGAQLDNGTTTIAGGVGSRFIGWTSESTPIGDTKTALGTGIPFAFIFRTDFTATFEIQDIPNANVPILDRLMAWLLRGGVVSVTVDDIGGPHVYASCYLAEGAKPAKKLFNKNDLTWSLALKLVNSAGAPMTCLYSS